MPDAICANIIRKCMFLTKVVPTVSYVRDMRNWCNVEECLQCHHSREHHFFDKHQYNYCLVCNCNGFKGKLILWYKDHYFQVLFNHFTYNYVLFLSNGIYLTWLFTTWLNLSYNAASSHEFSLLSKLWFQPLIEYSFAKGAHSFHSHLYNL